MIIPPFTSRQVTTLNAFAFGLQPGYVMVSVMNDLPMNPLAHELQQAGRRTARMATKMKLLKMLQEVRGIAQITNRRPAPRPPLLYLMQLRSQPGQPELPKRRLAIEKGKDTGHVPLPIKINHIRPDDPGAPMVSP